MHVAVLFDLESSLYPTSQNVVTETPTGTLPLGLRNPCSTESGGQDSEM